MRVCTLASGSSGNSLFIETAHARILVDAGISARQIRKRLSLLDVELSDIDAVITTHEHRDHTLAIPVLDSPVYVVSKTTDMWKDSVRQLRVFESGSDFEIKDLFISPFSVPHDAADPVGFAISDGRNKIGIVTDIGSVTGLVVQKLSDCNVLVVESNHDSNLILYSNYPWELKQRIKSRLGHLSNTECSTLLDNIIHAGLRYIVLAHLSEVNNTSDAALKEAYRVVNRNGAEGIDIHVAPRKKIGEVIEL